MSSCTWVMASIRSHQHDSLSVTLLGNTDHRGGGGVHLGPDLLDHGQPDPPDLTPPSIMNHLTTLIHVHWPWTIWLHWPVRPRPWTTCLPLTCTPAPWTTWPAFHRPWTTWHDPPPQTMDPWLDAPRPWTPDLMLPDYGPPDLTLPHKQNDRCLWKHYLPSPSVVLRMWSVTSPFLLEVLFCWLPYTWYEVRLKSTCSLTMNHCLSHENLWILIP